MIIEAMSEKIMKLARIMKMVEEIEECEADFLSIKNEIRLKIFELNLVRNEIQVEVQRRATN